MRELVEGVSAQLEARGKQPPAHLEQLCLVSVKRLLASRAIQIDGRGADEARPEASDLSLIFLEPLEPAERPAGPGPASRHEEGRALVGAGAAVPPADWR